MMKKWFEVSKSNKVAVFILVALILLRIVAAMIEVYKLNSSSLVSGEDESKSPIFTGAFFYTLVICFIIFRTIQGSNWAKFFVLIVLLIHSANFYQMIEYDFFPVWSISFILSLVQILLLVVAVVVVFSPKLKNIESS